MGEGDHDDSSSFSLSSCVFSCVCSWLCPFSSSCSDSSAMPKPSDKACGETASDELVELRRLPAVVGVILFTASDGVDGVEGSDGMLDRGEGGPMRPVPMPFPFPLALV